MKNLNKLIYLLIFLVIISCRKEDENYPTELAGVVLSQLDVCDKYIFPVQGEELKQLPDMMSKVAACQIPEDTLKNMCTTGLVDTYYDYPLLFVSIFPHDNKKNAMEMLKDNFNGLQELISREDCTEKLIAKYEQVDPADNLPYMTIEFMEITLAYDSICAIFSAEERKTLIRLGLKKLDEKKEYYSKVLIDDDKHSVCNTLYLIANVLYQENYPLLLECIEQDTACNCGQNLLVGKVFYGCDNKIQEIAQSFLEDN